MQQKQRRGGLCTTPLVLLLPVHCADDDVLLASTMNNRVGDGEEAVDGP